LLTNFDDIFGRVGCVNLLATNDGILLGIPIAMWLEELLKRIFLPL